MILKPGPMTMRELSVWFGLKPDSINKNPKSKKKKLKKLENFCLFHFEGKKLIIDQVYIPEFSSAYECVEENFVKEWGLVVDKDGIANWQQKEHVDTITRTGKAIWYKLAKLKRKH